jgi:hypothetical protein
MEAWLPAVGLGGSRTAATTSIYNISGVGMRTASINTNMSDVLDSYDQSMTSNRLTFDNSHAGREWCSSTT